MFTCLFVCESEFDRNHDKNHFGEEANIKAYENHGKNTSESVQCAFLCCKWKIKHTFSYMGKVSIDGNLK